MNDKEIHISQLATRMRDFGTEHASAFPSASVGGQKFTALNTLTNSIDQFGSEQTLTIGEMRAHTEAKSDARSLVRSLMKAIRETAVALESEQPGISKNFRMPPTNGDEALINSARAFITAATPIKNLFISHEMAATFLDDLAAAVTRFEESVSNHNLHRGRNAAATSSLRDALSQVLKLRRELDPIVRNKFRTDPATLAAWEVASHQERLPKKSAPAQSPAPQP